MSRTQRVYFQDTIYEIIPRAADTLPLPPTKTTNEVLLGILARTQRDEKVDLCNFVDMNNHNHFIAVSGCPNQLTKFHMELKKKTTDAVKALTGRKKLNLWEERTPVTHIATLQDIIDRHIYIFSNPTKAGLTNTIDEYPGLNTWKAFTQCEPSVDATITIDARWHPVIGIPRLPETLRLTAKQDAVLHNELIESGTALPTILTITPLAWLKEFGVTDPVRIEQIRQTIILGVRANEAEYARQRAHEKRTVIGPTQLPLTPYMRPHQPKKSTCRIFLICRNKKLRRALISTIKRIARVCRKCYEQAKSGIRVEWPPGTFIPWLPPPAARPKVRGHYT
jgi:REP element-mobilizing transposase RayT